MSKVVVFTNLTLDGVMQAPGRPDEDCRGGFEHGGWATPYAAMSAFAGYDNDSSIFGPFVLVIVLVHLKLFIGVCPWLEQRAL